MEPLENERLVYDTATERAHCLTPLAWDMLNLLDGKTSDAALARHFAISTDRVDVTLAALGAAGLLSSPGPKIDRGRRQALLGLAAAAPIVLSIVAPSVAEAASIVTCVPFTTCVKPGDCCGASGSDAKTCDSNLKCGNSTNNSKCKGAICQ
jgi:hypothetical protein